MKFHVSISCEPEEMCSIRHQKPLQTLGRHGFERHTRRYRIPLSNSGYQNNLYILGHRSHQSNVVPAICEPICGNTRTTCPLRISIYYKSFICDDNLTTQHRLLKCKLKLCKRVSTAYISTPSSNSWGYCPTCLARR
jgi:hypothetical protein